MAKIDWMYAPSVSIITATSGRRAALATIAAAPLSSMSSRLAPGGVYVSPRSQTLRPQGGQRLAVWWQAPCRRRRRAARPFHPAETIVYPGLALAPLQESSALRRGDARVLLRTAGLPPRLGRGRG